MLIVPYQDGPYLVRGPVVVRDQDGREIELVRDPVALCRCGKSRMRPFCDGTHRLVRFAAPSSPEKHGSDATETISGSAATISAEMASLRRRGTSAEAVVSAARSGVKRSSGQGSKTAQTRAAAAHRELGHVKERLESWLENGSNHAREHDALRCAQPLIEAAWLQLGEHRSVPSRYGPMDMHGPSCCLIRGALAALAPAASGDDGHVSRLIGGLEAVLCLLEPQRESP